MDLIGLLKNNGVAWGNRTRENAGYIKHLVCPDCGNDDAWIGLSNPHWLHCNHTESCGLNKRLPEAFPAIFEKIEKNYDPKTEPDAPALRYLSMVRGLDKSLAGLKFEYVKKTRKGKKTGLNCGGAVTFPISNGNGHSTYNGRLMNPPPGEQKGHNGPDTRGCWWQHPSVTYSADRRKFMCEAVINACSVMELGEDAFSVGFAMGNPSDYALPESLTKNLVIAFDYDDKGRAGAKKWKQAYPDAEVVMLPASEGDWNDFIIKHGSDAKSVFTDRFDEFATWGKMAVAENAEDHAKIFEDFFKRPIGLFEWQGCYWHSGKKTDAVPVSDFILEPVHYELDSSNPDANEYSVRVRVKSKSGASNAFVVPLEKFSSAAHMRSMFLKHAKAVWSGGEPAANALIKKIVGRNGVPVVRKMKVVGYDAESGCYVFPSYMIDTCGKMHFPEKGLFRVSGKEHVRPVTKQAQFLKPEKSDFVEIYDAICATWPGIGEVAVAWTAASLFVNQIKKEIGQFPHMSFYDDPQSGKSTLAVTVSRMCGRDREGIPVTKHANPKGIVRNIGIISGAPVALLEAGLTSMMDLSDFVLTTFGVGMLQTRAAFSNDMETNDIQNLAAIFFVQNVEPFQSKPEKERVISLRFELRNTNESTYNGFKRLKSFSPAQIAWFIPAIMEKRGLIESEWKKMYDARLAEYIGISNDRRVAENHAIVSVFHDLVKRVFGVDNDVSEFVCGMVRAKARECSGKADTLADHIFNTIDNMRQDTDGYSLSIHLVGDRLYINFPELFREMNRQGFSARTGPTEVYEAMKGHPAFVRSGISHRYTKYIDGSSHTKSSWVFDTGKILKVDRA